MSTWNLDPTHSEVQFKVKHLMITNVTGNLSGLEGSIEANDDTISDATVKFSANIETINTGNEQRDAHLRSADFFEAENFPVITFEGVGYTIGDEKITGKLTIKDVSKDVTFDVEYNGENTDPWGNKKVAFSVSSKIIRTDFGLNWNAALETGGVLVSEEVRLNAELQFVKG
jgi:polyisoprenoid-binding protein YceI